MYLSYFKNRTLWILDNYPLVLFYPLGCDTYIVSSMSLSQGGVRVCAQSLCTVSAFFFFLSQLLLCCVYAMKYSGSKCLKSLGVRSISTLGANLQILRL